MGNANTVNKMDFTFCTIIITVSVSFLLSQATLETGHGLIDSEKISQNGSNFHWHKAAHNHKDTKKKSSPKRIQIMLLIANVKQARFCYWSYLPSHGVGQVQRTGYDQESLVTQYSIHYPVNSFIWIQDRHEPAQEINVIDNCKYFS